MNISYNGKAWLLSIQCNVTGKFDHLGSVTVSNAGDMAQMLSFASQIGKEEIVLVTYGDITDLPVRTFGRLCLGVIQSSNTVAVLKSKKCPQFNLLNLLCNTSDYQLFAMSGATFLELMDRYESKPYDTPLDLAVYIAKFTKVVHLDCPPVNSGSIGGEWFKPFNIKIKQEDILIIIPSRCPENLFDFISRFGGTRYSVCLAVHKRDQAKFTECLGSIDTNLNIKYLLYSYDFNYSRIHNDVIKANMFNYEYFLLLNDDISNFNEDDLWRLMLPMFYGKDYKVGVVGAKLLYTNTNEVQHGGVIVDYNRGALHRGRNKRHIVGSTAHYEEIEAVTFALALTNLECFIRVNGFDENLPFDFNDTDYCLKARQAGYRVIYDSGCVAEHGESKTRKIDGCCGVIKDSDYFKHKWNIGSRK